MQNDLEKASNYFLKANNSAWNYNLWNISYIKWNYDSAINYFTKVSEFSSNLLLFRTNHNLWNAYYRIWEKDKDNELKHYENAVTYYWKALNIRFNEQTKSNYDFVLDKIKELDKNQNNSNKEIEENNSNSEEKKDEKSSESNWEKNVSDNSNLEEKQEVKLSQEQSKAIEEYKEMLKKEQDYNSQWFNKVYEWENIDIFDRFFNNSLLENDNKKDW